MFPKHIRRNVKGVVINESYKVQYNVARNTRRSKNDFDR